MAKITREMDYFIAGLEKGVDMAASAKIKKKSIHDTYSDVFF